MSGEIEKRQRIANGAERVNIILENNNIIPDLLVEVLPPVGY